MVYKLREDKAEEIKSKYRNSYFVEKAGLSKNYISLILNRKRNVSKVVAYVMTKLIDENAEILDYFEVA